MAFSRGQTKSNRRATLRRTFDPDAPFVRFDGQFAKRQAQAASMLFLLPSGEFLEQAGLNLKRDTDTGIADRQHHLALGFVLGSSG